MTKYFDSNKFLELYHLKYIDAEIATILGFSTPYITAYRNKHALPPNGRKGRRKKNENKISVVYVCPVGQKVTVDVSRLTQIPLYLKLKGRMSHFKECSKCQKCVPYSYFCMNFGRYQGPVEKVECYCELSLEEVV